MSILLRASPSLLSTFTEMPYLDGVRNLQAAFSPKFPIVKTSGNASCSIPKPKILSTRVKQFCTGILLCIPVINIIVDVALRFFYRGDLRKAHLVESQLPFYHDKRDFHLDNLSNNSTTHDKLIDRAKAYVKQEYPKAQIEFSEKDNFLFINLKTDENNNKKPYSFVIKPSVDQMVNEPYLDQMVDELQRLIDWIDDVHMMRPIHLATTKQLKIYGEAMHIKSDDKEKQSYRFLFDGEIFDDATSKGNFFLEKECGGSINISMTGMESNKNYYVYDRISGQILQGSSKRPNYTATVFMEENSDFRLLILSIKQEELFKINTLEEFPTSFGTLETHLKFYASELEDGTFFNIPIKWDDKLTETWTGI